MNPIEPPLPEGSKEIFLSHVKHSTGLAKVSTQTIFKFEEYMARFWRNNATNICQGEKKTYSLNKGIIQLLFQRVPQDYVPSFGPDDSQLRLCGMPLESRCSTIEGACCSQRRATERSGSHTGRARWKAEAEAPRNPTKRSENFAWWWQRQWKPH